MYNIELQKLLTPKLNMRVVQTNFNIKKDELTSLTLTYIAQL